MLYLQLLIINSSLISNYFDLKQFLLKIVRPDILFTKYFRPHRLTVRTSASQAGNRGSIPREVTA